MPQRQQHDTSLAIAVGAAQLVRGLLREEEERDFVAECYELAKRQIALFEEAIGRERQRLHPLEEKS